MKRHFAGYVNKFLHRTLKGPVFLRPARRGCYGPGRTKPAGKGQAMTGKDKGRTGGWLRRGFIAAAALGAGVAGYTLLWPGTRAADGQAPYDADLARTASERFESAAFAMRERARSYCTGDETPLAVLRAGKLLHDRRYSADNIDALIARGDADYNEYYGPRALFEYTEHTHMDFRGPPEKSVTGSADGVMEALAALGTLQSRGVVLTSYMLDADSAKGSVAAVYGTDGAGRSYLALGYVREIAERRGGQRDVTDRPALEVSGFRTVMEKIESGALDEAGRYAVFYSPFTVNGPAGWRISKIDDAPGVEQVKGHADTMLKVPGVPCLQ